MCTMYGVYRIPNFRIGLCLSFDNLSLISSVPTQTQSFASKPGIKLRKNVLIKTWMFKETIRVISRGPSCKDKNSRFITVPFQALSDQV